MRKTLILGIGNTLLTDEGAGIHALQALETSLRNEPSDDITFLDGGTLSFTLACWIEDHDNLIVLDAAELKADAGTVGTYVGTDMDDFLGKTKRSAHEVGLLDLLDIARLTEHLPENRALIGIQPDNMDWGMKPSEAVDSGIGTAVDEALTLIHRWRKLNLDQGGSDPALYPDDISSEAREA